VGHHHHGHAHGEADSRRLAIALALIVAFMCVEVVVGILADSLALLSDAAHMLTDAGALALALVAIRLTRRPAAGAMTYGLGRSEIVAAAINGSTLLVLGLLFVYESVRRLIDPHPVEGAAVLIVAVAGIVVNLVATWVLAGANRDSLNIEGAFQHILTDLAAFVATAVAGAVILLTGFERADGIAAMFVAVLMLRAAYYLLRESGRVFLEAAPRGLDPEAIGLRMAAQPGVIEVHDLHIWEVTSGFPAMSAHVLVARDRDCHDARRALEAVLHDEFGIEHTTLQVDHEGGELLEIEVSPREGSPSRRSPRSG
jgi:cobalt-zinc-cadmium efflux system protein